MATVNPPPQLQLPKEFISNKQQRNYFKQVETILFQLWQRTGGTVDAVENSQQNITSSSSRVSRNAARINSLELKEFEIVQVTNDTQTDKNQILICKNTSPITITLDPQAVEDDEVHIKRRGASITVLGSVDGNSSRVINRELWSDHLVFDGTDWSAI
jgi:hypothetical protein